MAYLTRLREWQTYIVSLKARLPLACLLCQSRTPGGFCLHCRQAVLASMGSEHARCGRCDLPLLVQGQACPDCPLLSPALERVITGFDYAWPGDLLIRQLKLQGRFSCAPVLADILVARLQQESRDHGEAALWQLPGLRVTTVPASRSALLQRGYNPAGEVAHALARRLGLSWQPGLIQSVSEGPEQKDLGRQARRERARERYRCTHRLDGAPVLIVDDVMTTGSTLSAIAEALAAQGAGRIYGVVLARTPSRTQQGIPGFTDEMVSESI